MMIKSGSKPVYPTNEEALQGMPEDSQAIAGKGTQAPEAAGNPFVDALRTVAMFCVAQKEKGNEAPVQAFQAFLQSLKGNVGEKGTKAFGESPLDSAQAPEIASNRIPEGVPKNGMQENRKAKILTM
jgi:hypothetical protein